MKFGIMLALLSFVGVPAFAATQQICGDLSSYGTPISVTATLDEGRLHVTVGPKATRSQYVFTPGSPTITGLRCL